MTVYAVAGYFSEAARRAAVSETYTTRSPGCAPGTYRRSAQGRCRAMPARAPRADGHIGCASPDAATAASAICGRLPAARGARAGMARQRRVATDTTAFIAARDLGKVADLRAALGLPREDARPIGNSGAGATTARKPGKDAAAPV